MQKTVAIFLVAALNFIALRQIFAQVEQIAPVYIASWNADTRLSTVWSYELGVSKATQVFTLKNTKTPSIMLLSAQELALLLDYRKDRQSEFDKNWGENFSPSQNIQWVKRFDATHLLVLTTNDIQDPFGRGADNNESGRFGYHEFLLLDLTAPYQLKSLFKIDYHDRATEDWYGCFIPFVYPTDVVLNPTRQQIAIELGPARDLCTNVRFRTLLIVDYSNSAVWVTKLPLASYPIWSPDGEWLAYIQSQCKGSGLWKMEGLTCSAALDIRNTMSGKTTIVSTLQSVPTTSKVETLTWRDSHTLLYAWPYLSRCDCDNGATSFKQFQIEYGVIFPMELPNIQAVHLERLYLLGASITPRFLIGVGVNRSTGEAKTFVFSPPDIINALDIAGSVQYNSRYPERLLIIVGAKSNGKVMVLTEDLHQTSFELSKILPENEWVFNSVTP
jgi:hypothetical protein